MRKLMTVATATILVLGLPVSAQAAGTPPETTTEHVAGEVTHADDENFCTGDPIKVTQTTDSVSHLTAFADGSYHFSTTRRGSILIDTVDPALPDYSGSFVVTINDGVSGQGERFGFTFSLRATGTDGSIEAFLVLAHATVVDGRLIVEFDELRCR